MKYILTSLIWFLIFTVTTFSQTDPIVFGVVSRGDLETQPYTQEKGAEAIVLCDYAVSKMVYNDGFKIEMERHVRIKIIKKNGYDYANIRIPYTNDDKLTELKASTHNLENDQPVEIPLNKKQFYIEKVNLYRNVTRFAFPQVREGSVIEYTYKLTTPEIHTFIPFRFQSTIPVRYAEYWAIIPDYFKYKTNFRGDTKRVLYSRNTTNGYFDTYSVNIEVNHWIGNNIPAFRPELNMPAISDFITCVTFELGSVNFPNYYYEVSPGYPKLTERLLEDSEFGRPISSTFLFTKEVKKITANKISKFDKMQAIYDYIKGYMKWDGDEEVFVSKTLLKAYHDKRGTNAEINLMLVNMLRTAGINADPVILSTRDNGVLNPYVAMIQKINYVICLAEIDSKEYLLDATDENRPLGMLPFSCLNNQGWVVNQSRGRWVDLLQNEKNNNSVYYDLNLDENGSLKGSMKIVINGYDAIEVRRIMKIMGEEQFKEDAIARSGNLTINDLRFQNLDSLKLPVIATCQIEISHATQCFNDLMIFNILSLLKEKENPFIKETRNFPLDFGCPTENFFNYTIHLPLNYTLSELPKSINLALPNKDAQFAYNANSLGNILTVTGKFSINKIYYNTDEYPSLREFYTQMLKKSNEVVILKKN